jgi:hypothetical protein
LDISFASSTAGNPVAASSFAMDCFLKNLSKESTLPIVYWNYLIQTIITISYIFISLGILVAFASKKTKGRVSYSITI